MLAIIILPWSIISVLPFVVIYDNVFSGHKIYIFSIITISLILISYIIKPYIRN